MELSERRIVTVDEFLKLLTDEESYDDVMVVRSAECEVKDGEEGKREQTWTISTGAKDRDRDTINPLGWKLTHFKKNPVVLFGHDYRSLPVARAPRTKIDRDRPALVSTAEYTPDSVYPENFAGIRGETVYQFVKHKFLNAASVGFYPLAWERREPEEGEGWAGFDFIKQELLEWSIVPVPSLPEALVEARGMIPDIYIEDWTKWAEELLDRREGEESDVVLLRAEKGSLELLETGLWVIRGSPLTLSVDGTSNEFETGAAEVKMRSVEVEEKEEELPNAIKTDVGHCARCGEDHDGLVFLQLTQPIAESMTHWAVCPETEEPILLGVTVSPAEPVELGSDGTGGTWEIGTDELIEPEKKEPEPQEPEEEEEDLLAVLDHLEPKQEEEEEPDLIDVLTSDVGKEALRDVVREIAEERDAAFTMETTGRLPD